MATRTLTGAIAAIAIGMVASPTFAQVSEQITPPGVLPRPTTSNGEHLTLTSIRRETLPDAQRVMLELDGEAAFYDERLERPVRVFIDLKNTSVRSDLEDSALQFPDGWVRQIRVAPRPGRITRVALELRGAPRYSIYALYNPYRIVVDIEGPVAEALGAIPTVAPLTGPPATDGNGSLSLSRQLGLGISRVVIDAGHGGHDAGARVSDITEAEVALDVALRLEKLLLNVPGVEVVMTRRTDVFIPLDERTAIANSVGADLFLSVHVNASTTPSARGIETYFLNFAPNKDAEAIAARENAGSSRTMHDLPGILKTLALNNKIGESRDFASLVQNAMIDRLQKVNREARNLGVKQAPFMVLIGATMPSILAEISFITNRREATLLKSQAYRQAIAEGLFNGVSRYQRSLKAAQSVASQ